MSENNSKKTLKNEESVKVDKNAKQEGELDIKELKDVVGGRRGVPSGTKKVQF